MYLRKTLMLLYYIVDKCQLFEKSIFFTRLNERQKNFIQNESSHNTKIFNNYFKENLFVHTYFISCTQFLLIVLIKKSGLNPTVNTFCFHLNMILGIMYVLYYVYMYIKAAVEGSM